MGNQKHETIEPSKGIESRLSRVLRTPRLSVKFIAFALAVSIFLGAVRALEPGHGKTIVAAYLIGSRGTVLNAIFLGGIVTFTHTISVIILGTITLFASKYVLPEQIFPWLGCVSGVFIMGVGIWMLVRHSLGLFVRHSHTYDHHDCSYEGETVESQDHPHHAEEEHTHDHQNSKREHSHQEPSQISWGSLVSLGIAGGLVPCPGALVILLAAIALNRIAFGLMLIVSFSFGMAAVLTAIGVLMVVARSTLDRFAGGERFILRLP